MVTIGRPDSEELSRSALRDIGDALEVANTESDEKPLPLTPDFAEIVAEIRSVLSLAEIGEVTGVKERQVHRWLAGTHNPQGEARNRLLALFQVVGYLQLGLSSERIKVWLWSPQPELAGRPVDCLRNQEQSGLVLAAARALALRSSLDDEYLVALAKRGNASAYDEIVRRYRGLVRLKASSYFLLGGNSDDLIQEGLLGLYKAIRDFKPDLESSFRGFAEIYITRQIITAVKTAIRDSSAKPESPDVPADDRQGLPIQEPANQRIAAEALEAVVVSLSGSSGVLSDPESRILSLYLDGYSPTTIAEQLESETQIVDQALQRIKRKVDAHLSVGR